MDYLTSCMTRWVHTYAKDFVCVHTYIHTYIHRVLCACMYVSKCLSNTIGSMDGLFDFVHDAVSIVHMLKISCVCVHVCVYRVLRTYMWGVVFLARDAARDTPILTIIEGHFQIFQRFSSCKLVLKTVESSFAALNYSEIASTYTHMIYKKHIYTYANILGWIFPCVCMYVCMFV